MNPLMGNPKLKPGRFRVGDRVRLLVGWDGMEGEIAEDFGNIGVGGRRLYYVRIKPDEWNEMLLLYGEDDLEAAAG